MTVTIPDSIPTQYLFFAALIGFVMYMLRAAARAEKTHEQKTQGIERDKAARKIELRKRFAPYSYRSWPNFDKRRWIKRQVKKESKAKKIDKDIFIH